MVMTGQVCSGAGLYTLAGALVAGGAWYLLQPRRIAARRLRRTTTAAAELATWRGRRLLPWQFVRNAGRVLIAQSSWRASTRVVVTDGLLLVGFAAILVMVSLQGGGTCR
jgi:hypothetical protein